MLEKVSEELEEVHDVITKNAGEERLREEVGDLLFACVNLARHLERRSGNRVTSKQS